MLITDNDCITPIELSSTDPEVTNLPANMSERNLAPIAGPESVIRHAVEYVCRDLASKFQNYSGYLMSPGNSANHIAAVMNVYSTSVSRMRMKINQVVALEPDPTKRMVQDVVRYYALYSFFRSMLHRKNDDRYEKKMDHYDRETKLAWQRLESTGLPIILNPLAAPGAVREFRAGTWRNDNLSSGGSGSSETGNAYDVQITYTGTAYRSWRNPANSESAPSELASIEVPAGEVITIDISSLNPPDGNQPLIGTADGIYSPMAASGWNIYAGRSGETLWLQNSTPIDIGTTSYTFTDVPTLDNGLTVGVGQFPDYNYAFVRTVSRA